MVQILGHKPIRLPYFYRSPDNKSCDELPVAFIITDGISIPLIVSVLSSFEQETNKTNAMITNAILFFHFTLFL
jgi:hypothetical protein